MRADSVVIRDIRTNENNQLQFKLLVLAGGETVVPGDAIRAAVQVWREHVIHVVKREREGERSEGGK